MIHPDYLSKSWFDKGNKECVQLGDEVEAYWGIAANGKYLEIVGNIHENRELWE